MIIKYANNLITPISESGFIKVRVITELGAIPLEGSTVTIYASLNELVPIETVTTDENGNAPILKIPVAYNPEVTEMNPKYKSAA